MRIDFCPFQFLFSYPVLLLLYLNKITYLIYMLVLFSLLCVCVACTSGFETSSPVYGCMTYCLNFAHWVSLWLASLEFFLYLFCPVLVAFPAKTQLM